MSDRKLEREADDRLIGGVCGGLAHYLGVNSKLMRGLFVVSVFFSAGITLGIYLLLWFLVPARTSIRDKLSKDLRRKVRRLDQLIDSACARLNQPGSQARLRHVQELIETLLPELDSRAKTLKPELQPINEAAFVHLPNLLENFLRLPVGGLNSDAASKGKSAQQDLIDEFLKLERSLTNAAKARYGEQYAKTADALDTLHSKFEDDPTAPFRLKLESLQSRSAGRLDPDATAKIESIKNSLVAALGRLQQTADPTDPNLYNVKQIALEYLPETVDKYLALPQGLAGSDRTEGKTAQTVLHEQLDVLDGALNRLVTSLYQEDAQGLYTHGHFLRDKFVDPTKEWSGP